LPNKTTLNEKELLQRLSGGDIAALKVIVKSYYPILCKFAEQFLPDSGLAEDIVQETFIKFWQYEGSFDSLLKLKSFLYTVTRNGCLNLQRGREREEDKHQKSAVFQSTSAEEEDAVYDEITRLERLHQINQVVRQMPLRMQRVFLLSFEQGLSINEIAAKMNISVKTVRNQKYRSLVLLRTRLTNSGGALLFLAGLLQK
jgi:RNA polymerase sigma-70 factor (ECF subfamily)